MIEAPQLACERERLAALRALRVLGTPAEERFDRITRLARDLFEVKIALVSLVDRDRQWFKSRQGLAASETPRSISFCGHAIASHEALVVEDTLQDERFSDNPLVTGAPHIRFYAGCPLRAPNGHLIGTLCIIDDAPRAFGERDKDLLHDLARVVEAELCNPVRALLDPSERLSWRTRARAQLYRLPSSRLASLSLATVCSLLLGLAAATWDRSQLKAHAAQVRQATQHAHGLMRGELETALNAKLHLVFGLSGLVRSSDDIDQSVFDAFAAQLVREVQHVRSLQLAPNGVVTYVWPYRGNEAAIGHDLLADPKRRAAAEQAIASRRLWVAGPLNLIQGGVALLGRLPVFLPSAEGDGSENFWGFATILIDLPGLLGEVGLREETGDYRYALRGRDAAGADGAVFFGDASLFTADALVAEIALPAGSWLLVAAPAAGWPKSWPGQVGFRIGAGLVCLIVFGLVYFLVRLPHTMQQAVSRATEQLEASQSRFRGAIAALPAGFVIFDRDDRLAVCNDRFRALYARSRPVLQTGRKFEEILRYGLRNGQYHDAPIELAQAQDSLYAEMMARHGERSHAADVRLADGIWVRVFEEQMSDGGRVAFHVDVSEERAHEEELEEARQRAEQANQAKSTFLATISHEVRTPLNGVLGLLGVLREDAGFTEEQSRYLQTAHQSAEHLLSLLNEILDISKMESGTLSLEPADFPLGSMLRGAVELVRGQAQMKQIDLRVELDESLDVAVRGDEGRLRQVLLNLLSNAIKFTDAGEVTLVGRAVTGGDPNRLGLRIEVRDTGMGFDPEQASSLFQPFSQLEQDATRRFSGTGLGLAICRRLIDMMGGHISAEGRPGEGATFRVALDLPRGQLDAAMVEQDAPVPTPASEQRDNVRVLLAEDSPTNQLVIKAMLKDTGYSLDVVSDGQEAVDAVSRLRYDLILMDVFMPELDGLGATRQIRERYGTGEMPIIALTANAMQGDAQRFFDAGMDDYLSKPINRRLLLNTLWRWVEQPRDSAARAVSPTP